MKKILLISFFLHLIFFNQILSDDFKTTDKKEDIDYIQLGVKIFESLEKECYPVLNKSLGERMKYEMDKEFPWITDSIGKGINDIGDEIECLQTLKNTTFFIVNFYKLNLSLILDNDQALMDFLEIHNFTMGICLMYSCRDAFYRYLQILAEFLNYLASKKPANPNLVSIYESYITDNLTANAGINNNVEEDANNRKRNLFLDDDLKTKNFKEAVLFVILAIIALKIIGGIVRIILIPKGYDKYVAEIINQSNKENNEDIDEKLNLAPKHKINEPLNDESNTKEYNPLFDFSEKLPKPARFLRIFDLINDIYYLSSKRNRYYNDNGLDVIVFNRALVIFFLIFSNTFSALITLPSEEIINSSFFKSWLNITYRLSNNALICWAFLEGAYTTYKLLSYIQSELFVYYIEKDKNYQKLYKKLPIIFVKFLVLMIPKIITFFLIFFIFYYRIEDYRFVPNAKATFHHIIINIFKNGIKCDSSENGAVHPFIDDVFHYNIDDFKICYEFVYFYMNMFLSTLCFMVVSYLFFVFKNKIFEIVVIALNFIFFFVSVIFVKDSRDEIYNSDNTKILLLHYHIKGQTYSTKIFQSFIGFYHLGFIIGYLIFNSENMKHRINRLRYEYNKVDIKPSNNKKDDDKSISLDEPLSEGGETEQSFNSRTLSYDTLNKEQSDKNETNYNIFNYYYPLKETKKILIAISKWNISVKIILIIVGIGLLILIDFILLIYIFKANGNFEIEFTNGAKFLFRYEKHFFILIYFCMIVIMLTLPKKGSIRSFMSSKIFICISRIGFLITCVSHVFTYFSFLIFALKVKLYVPTFVIISFGNFLLFFIVCIFLCAIFDLPLKIIIKKLLRINRKKDSIVF